MMTTRRTGDDGEEGSISDQVAKVSPTVWVPKYSLTSQKPSVVDMGEEDRARPDGKDEESGLDRGHLPREGRHDPRGGDRRDGRGAGRETHCDGDEPSGDQGRDCGLLDPRRDDRRDPGIDEVYGRAALRRR